MKSGTKRVLNGAYLYGRFHNHSRSSRANKNPSYDSPKSKTALPIDCFTHPYPRVDKPKNGDLYCKVGLELSTRRRFPLWFAESRRELKNFPRENPTEKGQIMELVEMLKNLQANVEERLRETDQYGGEIDELFNEIISELKKPKTCETCSKWKQHSGSIFGVCADGNRSHFSDEDTTYDYGCTYYRLKDSK